MGEHAITVANLTKTFAMPGGDALVANDNLSFNVRRGEIFGLLGPNGAGKTTLVHQLLGLLTPTAGTIAVEGIDVASQPAAVKRLVGFLPQSGIPMRWIEVERALYYTGRLRRQGKAEARRQVEELIGRLDLQDVRRRYVHSLSGGMKRIVNVAMALMGWPPVLVLDEPTNELDPARRRTIWSLLHQLNAERGTTCLLVTHNILEAEQVIQRVLVLQRGQAVALGTPGELKQRSGGLVRLSLRTRDDQAMPAAVAAALEAYGALESARTGHYLLQIQPGHVGAVTDLIVREVGFDRLDDFRLAPPSLEDVYLQLERSERSDGDGAE